MAGSNLIFPPSSPILARLAPRVVLWRVLMSTLTHNRGQISENELFNQIFIFRFAFFTCQPRLSPRNEKSRGFSVQSWPDNLFQFAYFSCESKPVHLGKNEGKNPNFCVKELRYHCANRPPGRNVEWRTKNEKAKLPSNGIAVLVSSFFISESLLPQRLEQNQGHAIR